MVKISGGDSISKTESLLDLISNTEKLSKKFSDLISKTDSSLDLYMDKERSEFVEVMGKCLSGIVELMKPYSVSDSPWNLCDSKEFPLEISEEKLKKGSSGSVDSGVVFPFKARSQYLSSDSRSDEAHDIREMWGGIKKLEMSGVSGEGSHLVKARTQYSVSDLQSDLAYSETDAKKQQGNGEKIKIDFKKVMKILDEF